MPVERLLIVGTLGGGGIHRYVESQRQQLPDRIDASVYDMYSDPNGSGVLWFLRSAVLAVLAAVRFPFRSRPDVVHVHTSHHYSFVRAAFYVLFAAHVWRRPIVLHVHGSSFDEFLRDGSWILQRLRSTVFAASDAVVVLSSYWRDALEGPVPEQRLRVVPNAVAPEAYEPAFDVDPPHIVYLSAHVERKGIRTFVAAVDELYERSTREFEVTIAGKGPLADEAERLATSRDDVSYRGYVSEAEKRALLASASIYALPTHAEGLPIAMLEAMAGGNAIVSTPVGGIPEVIGPDNGALVEPRDADGLVDALETLVDDPAVVDGMGRQNRDLVRERYNWDVAVESLLAIYRDVTADGAVGSSDEWPEDVSVRTNVGQSSTDAETQAGVSPGAQVDGSPDSQDDAPSSESAAEQRSESTVKGQ